MSLDRCHGGLLTLLGHYSTMGVFGPLLATFKDAVLKAEKLAEDGYIVTFGIKPDTPETGYGYIASGDRIMTDKEIFTVDE